MIVTPYQWADYEESVYNITLKASQVGVLTLSTGNSTFDIGLDDLNVFLIQTCSSYTLKVIAVSSVFGFSQPSLVEFVSPPKGMFSYYFTAPADSYCCMCTAEMPEFHKINATVYFNSFGTPFFTFYMHRFIIMQSY